MKIDGKAIAQNILENLKKEVEKSKISPTLAAILVSQDPASLSYIKQKQKAVDEISAKLILKKFPSEISQISLISQISQISLNPEIHGLIVQLPIPSHINHARIAQAIAQEKDVDGFHPKSPFNPPIALAVLKILKFIWLLKKDETTYKRLQKVVLDKDERQVKMLYNIFLKQLNNQKNGQQKNFINWLKGNKILILGRGETAGKPIANTLRKMCLNFEVAHSKTRDTNRLLKKADIIISCIGKRNFIKGSMIKKGTICVGVGISRIQIKKLEAGSWKLEAALAGDFEESSVSKIASFYTPTPGGIGPVNVACLMENLIKSWQTKKIIEKRVLCLLKKNKKKLLK